VEKPALTSPEGQQVRNASGSNLEAVKAANPNKSDGSVHNWAMKSPAEKLAYAESTGQDASLQLVERNSAGKEVVIAARLMPAETGTDNRPIKDYGYEVKQVGEHQVIKTGVEYQAGKPPEVTESSLFEKIAALPLDQQAQVIGAGIKAYSREMTHQQFRIGVGMITGLGDGVVGLAQGAESLGNTIIGVAQFSRDVMANDPAALDTAGKAGESIGKLLVSGVHVYSAAETYLESIGAATNVGDYGKALRDVAWLGQQVNSRWESMSPEEKTKLVTKASVESLGGMAVGFGTDKLAKSIKITEALEALGAEASTMGPSVREKTQNLIARLQYELAPDPMAVTTDGQLVRVPKAPFNPETNMLMSKAEDAGKGQSNGESVFRGDHDVYSRTNTKGRPKSYINEDGNLTPANPEGIYKGQKVTVEEHLAARWCRGAKANSPYTSFGEKDGVLKTFGQGTGLTLDLKELRAAIASGEVKNVRIYEHQEVIKALNESRFHDHVKGKLLTWAKAHKEVIVEGIIPGKFVEIGLK